MALKIAPKDKFKKGHTLYIFIHICAAEFVSVLQVLSLRQL